MFVRQLMGRETDQNNKISNQIESEFIDDRTSIHVPSVHVIPKNFDGQVMSGLQPVEDINQLYDQYIESVLNVFKIPQKIKSGNMERNNEISLNARIFQGEIQTLCRHLNNLCENVYTIIYGGDKKDIQFLIALRSQGTAQNGKYGNKNLNGFTKKQKDDNRVMKTELQYFKPDKAKAASYHPPLETDKNKSKSKK